MKKKKVKKLKALVKELRVALKQKSEVIEYYSQNAQSNAYYDWGIPNLR